MAAKDALLLPVGGADFSLACALADYAATESATNWHAVFVRLGKSLAEYRRGRLEAANDWADRIVSATTGSMHYKATACFVQALCAARPGQNESTSRLIEQGNKLIKRPNDYVTGRFGDTWCDLAIAELLGSEAESFLQGQGTSRR